MIKPNNSPHNFYLVRGLLYLKHYRNINEKSIQPPIRNKRLYRLVGAARLTSLKLRRCVIVSAAILPSRLLLLVKLASSQVREVIVSPTKEPPAKGWFFVDGG